MTSLLDTFLSVDEFKRVSARVEDYLEQITKLPREKKIKQIKQIFDFKKLFSTDSVQGMAGIMQIDTGLMNNVEDNVEPIMHDIVFKVSIEMNRSIEHEYFVLRKLNALRSYCPNFVATLGLLPAYVTREFFDDECNREGNLMDVKTNPVQCNYLLLEYVSDVTFRHVWKFAPKATVTSVMLMVLCALQIAQNKLQFVHYDLHSGNILMRKVEDDAYFAYIIEGDVYVVPTHGWYPVMIDMGSSYVKGIDERPTRTSIAHYHRGLQSTFFDSVSDIHHFLLSALSRLEKADSQTSEFRRHFRVISTRLMHMFRHSNIWRYNGWKQLPCNLIYMFNSLMYKCKPETCEFFTELRSEVVDTLALGVKLPWQELSEQELNHMLRYYYPTLQKINDLDATMLLVRASIEDINHFLRVFDDDPMTTTDVQVLYALRTLVEHASLMVEEGNTFVLNQGVLNTFKQVIQPMYSKISYKLDINRSFRGAAVICRVMRHLLCHFNQTNVDLATEWNEKCDVHKPIEAAKFIMQNTGIRRDFLPTTPIYVWDSDRETHHKVTFGELQIKSDEDDIEGIIHRWSSSKVT